jgi:hypothetical protein
MFALQFTPLGKTSRKVENSTIYIDMNNALMNLHDNFYLVL